ncbi:MAG: hypothetical protein ACFB16_13700 [Phormidesmis sp.]
MGEIDFEIAGEQLRSHQLSELFTQSLGWQPASALLSVQQHFNQQCLPIAERDGVIVWQVPLSAKTRFTPMLRHQIYTALSNNSAPSETRSIGSDPSIPKTSTPDPSIPKPSTQTAHHLIIFSAADRSRSLWCQSPWQSALYVAGQPLALWLFRLRRLLDSPSGTSPSLFPVVSCESFRDETFSSLIAEIEQAISGIERIADRQIYSVLTLQRLILLQQLQHKGWLNGENWYLQTRFGEAASQGENLFFKTCLQPLYRSLALPTLERPLALQQQVGEVPFIGQLFQKHRLEELYSVTVEDYAFENVLGWLSEQTNTGILNPWLASDIGFWLEQYWRRRDGIAPVKVDLSSLGLSICAQTLDQLLLDRLDLFSQSRRRDKQRSAGDWDSFAPPVAIAPQEKTLNDLLFNANAQVCRRLIQEILPELRILDPYCGSGGLLVVFHQRLTEIFGLLTGYIQQNQDAQLKLWHSALSAHSEGRSADRTGIVLKNIQERILKNTLYGVAPSTEMAESTHFQLLLHLVATAQRVEEIEPLIDLEFNVMTGNALVGYISVDEERFDQVNQAGAGSASSVLQGNLLQPLAADSYQTILREKNIALEHYQSRSQVLAKAHSVPAYARAALLREEILTLDSKAQHKLDLLMLSHMSQQLGVRYRETQIADKPHRRPLTLSDIKSLGPFHWGYHFNAIINRGGFDVVACLPPWHTFKPTVSEFICRYPDLAQQNGLSERTLKTSKQALSKADPAVAAAWFDYQDRYVCVSDYLSRSELYTHQYSTADGKSARHQPARERLFIEQSYNLLSAHGVGAVCVPVDMLADERAQPLLRFLHSCSDRCYFSATQCTDPAALLAVWRK